ncbi:hypothetical protein H6G89_12240 [Oscillatoria sp. FACHB-1407]|uniref:hypothetical protein n=1 Tax=Oscillatoria sp. FACHB-1407 TaxID=2692847 RepID=UPI001685AFF3|nr:hypothetical protein [Oscillatoria sp. FACHB-1407]MBD2461819.1 hypothetical protein [Oscillatoria sp. FACHB-1407]
MRLSPLTAYYIRKLLHQQETKLRFIVAPGAAVQADLLTDLNRVLESLYLEESEICTIAGELEKLVRLHQLLTSQGIKYPQEALEIERQIFWILGFKTR